MATKKNNGKMTIAETREALEKANEKLENGCRCAMCKKIKDMETGFYLDTDPIFNEKSFSRICRECAKGIACRKDKNGDYHSPTRESVQLALYYLNKPFLENVWNSSIQESENMLSGSKFTNSWGCYIKNIQMINYIGMTYKNSDMFKEKIIYDDETTEEEMIKSHSGQDTYDSFLKNKKDVIRLLDYDPFEKEPVNDQPFLYAQLLGLLDSSEEANEDMMRTASAISIVRGFLQQSKIDDTIAKLMIDINNLQENSATIKSLQESKQKLTSIIKDLAAESCLSLKNSRHSVKGENTWTGKLKKIKELNLRDGQVNGFDIGTCRGMEQVLDLSNASIMKQLALDESEWSDMVAELRKVRIELQTQLDNYKEINRILLQENMDLKDYLEEQGIDLKKDIVDLKKLYSPFSSLEESEEVDSNESDNSSE